MSIPTLQDVRAFLSRLVAPVPPELETCEYDCKDRNCSVGQWKTCENRQGSRPTALRLPDRSK
jgi:hypothetical protein